jgi:hypothetical protein
VEGFTMVKNEFIFGSELAPPAFRIALYLAAKPDNWVVRQADVRKHCKGIGQDAYFKAIGQLVDGGYLQRGTATPDGRTPPVITKKLDGTVRWPARIGTPEDGATVYPLVDANSGNPSWAIPVGERRELQRTDSTKNDLTNPSKCEGCPSEGPLSLWIGPGPSGGNISGMLCPKCFAEVTWLSSHDWDRSQWDGLAS